MKKNKYYIGLDIAAKSFAATILKTPSEPTLTKTDIPNSFDGCQELVDWLKANYVKPRQGIICMEATGVYCENLCYWLASKGFKVALESPLKVKRAFKLSEHKTDPVDSQQIAQYAYRFKDQLNFWKLKADIVEQIRTLLTARELFSKQLTSNKNALHALNYKYVQTPLANQAHQRTIQQLKENIKDIDQQLKELIDQDPALGHNVNLLKSIPGVGLLLASNILVLTQGFTQSICPKKLAAYIGICPYKHQSGSSVNKKPKSRRYGPATLRKLIHLAAASVRTHHLQSKKYFLRKVAEGKAKRLVINNIANKIVTLICAILKSQTQFMENFKSINPIFIKKTA